MESTDIGTEAKVYESLWSEGNESRSRDHLQDFYFQRYTQENEKYYEDVK